MAETAAQPASKAYERARRIQGEPLQQVDPEPSNWYCMREPCYQLPHDATQWEGDMPVCNGRDHGRLGPVTTT